jgi:hypothetical protein
MGMQRERRGNHFSTEKDNLQGTLEKKGLLVESPGRCQILDTPWFPSNHSIKLGFDLMFT